MAWGNRPAEKAASLPAGEPGRQEQGAEEHPRPGGVLQGVEKPHRRGPQHPQEGIEDPHPEGGAEQAEEEPLFPALPGAPGPEAEGKERIYSLVRRLAGRFRAEFGTLSCRELLQLPEDCEESATPSARTAAYYEARPCERCIAFCARQAAELLNGSHPDLR